MPGWIGFTVADELFNFLYRGTPITIGDDLWLRLLVSPSNRGGGGTETDYTGYERLILPRDSSVFSVSANGLILNSALIEFPIATSAGNGDVTAFDVVNTSSGAFTKIYNGGPILPAKSVIVGKSPRFGPGKLQFTF